MAQRAEKPWTVEAFFAWQERQANRYELVRGFPLRLMAGAKNAHDDIAVNMLVSIGNQLRGSGCRPFTGDGSVETFPGQIRRPDVGVDCGRRDPNAFKAAEPRMVTEVLSPSTRDFDTIEKLAEYKTVETMDYVLVVEPNAPEVVLWSRSPDRSWEKSRIEGLEAVVAMPGIAVELPLSEIYDGVVFPAQPRLLPG